MTNPIVLAATTQHPVVNHILQEIITRYECSFPGYMRAYYMIGSYADGSAVPISDI